MVVTIITPMHNKGPYVGQTIESVLSQTMPDLEMLVVENHSIDEGPRVVEEWLRRDSRVRLIFAPPEVRGPGAARNLGLSEAKGKWILFLDADDLLEPSYLECRLSVLESYPEAKIIAGPWKNFYPETPHVFETHLPNGWRPPFGSPPDSIFAYSPWALHAAIVHREALGGSAPWLEELDGLPAEDNAFWFPVLYGKTIYWNGSSGALYRKKTVNSRDESALDFEKAFHAVQATIASNNNFLDSIGKRMSAPMADVTVRVFENFLKKNGANGLKRDEILDQISFHLRRSSLFNPGMVFRRIIY